MQKTKEESIPIPPGNHIRYAGHHWLEERYDGFMRQIVLQWQPGMRQWCHSGDVATGCHVPTEGFRYICPVPYPDELVLDKKEG